MMSDRGPLTGPRSSYRGPDQGIPAPADYPGARVSRILDSSTPGAELFAVLVAYPSAGGRAPGRQPFTK